MTPSDRINIILRELRGLCGLNSPSDGARRMAFFEAEIPLPPDLEQAGMAAVDVAGREILVMKFGDEYRAIDRECPHAYADMEDAELYGKDIQCPLHGYLFDTDTGQCITLRGLWAQTYHVERRGDVLALSAKPMGGRNVKKPWE